MKDYKTLLRDYWKIEFQIGKLEEDFKISLEAVCEPYSKVEPSVIYAFEDLLTKKLNILIAIGDAQREELVKLEVVDLAKYKDLKRRLV